MSEYRAYLIGADGRISDRIDLDCVDDEAAKEAARRLVDGLDVELWNGTRRVETFPRKD